MVVLVDSSTCRVCVAIFPLLPSLSLSLSVSLVLGCAFVTYNTRTAAVEAQKNLHEKKTLPGVSMECPRVMWDVLKCDVE